MAGETNETIVITAKFVDDVTRGLTTVREKFQQFGSVLDANNIASSKAGAGIRNFSKNINGFNNFLKGAISSFSRFRMEFLGVMFFGMSIQRLFEGLLRPAFDLVGIFELWNTILELLFLPVALLLLPFFEKLLEWVVEMPDEMKELIGMIVLFAAGLGLAMFAIGTIILGITSLITMFTNLTGGVAGLFGPFSGIVQSLLMIGGAALGVKGAFAVWDLVKPIIDKVFEKLQLTDVITKLFTALGIEVDATKGPFESFKDFAINSITAVLEKIGLSKDELGKWKTTIDNVMNDAKEYFNKFKATAKEAMDSFLKGLGEGDTKTLSFRETLKKLVDKVLELVPKISELAGSITKLAKDIDSSQILFVMENIVGVLKMIVGWAQSAINLLRYFSGGMSQNEAYNYEGGNNPDMISSFFRGISLLLQNFGMKTVPKAMGGLITKPTMALLGENGPEMVSPLNNSSNIGSISPTYFISVNGSNGINARSLASELNEFLVNDYRRLTYR